MGKLKLTEGQGTLTVRQLKPREDSGDLSGEDFEIESTHRSVEPSVSSNKVTRPSTPLTGKGHLDVDAVLERSIRKVAGE